MTKGNGKPCKKCGTSEWRENGQCKSCAIANSRKWERNNRDKVTSSKRKWNKNNRDKANASNRKWKKDNPDKVTAGKRKWNKNNPDKANAKNQRRRTAKTNAGGSYTSYEWDQLIKQQDGRCLKCGKKEKLTVDHVIPVSKGGTSNIDNIQGLCQSCNSSKGTKSTGYRKQKGIIRWIQDKLF